MYFLQFFVSVVRRVLSPQLRVSPSIWISNKDYQDLLEDFVIIEDLLMICCCDF